MKPERIVWDGANPNIAGRQLAMNFRFAVAGGNATPDEPGSEGVLWWNKYADSTRGRVSAKTPAASFLDRCSTTKTCPKIFETFGGLEFWQLRMSPNLVGTDAKADIPLPSNVRRYFSPGTTHGGGRGGFSTVTPAPPNGCGTAHQSQSTDRDAARAHSGSGRLGDQGNRAASEPISALG